MSNPAVERLAGARIPTSDGQFQLYYYANTLDDKEHLALVYGDIALDDEVLVRVHSECFTGDVIGSLRCDCGEQLNRSMHLVAQEGAGIILYLRQEGRGIGLLEKLKAYNLQDDGFDTVEANLELGHDADERDYTVAALILEDLGVSAVRLLTNNPAKIDGLERHHLTVVERIPLSTPLNVENERYLQTKVDRMQHLLELGPRHGRRSDGNGLRSMPLPPPSRERDEGRPFVTLSYAQSLDGSIAAVPGQPFELSGTESLVLTHRLRAAHDAILVGIGTVLSDDPRLTVRHAEGTHPRPVVLDTRLRMPPAAGLLNGRGPAPIIATSASADDASRTALQEAGATVLTVPVGDDGQIDLATLLDRLAQMGHRSVMVEGGSEVITSFLTARLVDHLVITLVNMLVGGMPALRPMSMNGSVPASRAAYPRLRNMRYRWYGEDLVIEGEPYWEDT